MNITSYIQRLQEIGAHYDSMRDKTLFTVWAPYAAKVELELMPPKSLSVEMKQDQEGYWEIEVPEVRPGTRYYYVLDEEKYRADPASRFQPEGIQGPSEVTGNQFDWTDAGWGGIPPGDMIVYELHTGTFTKEGTFQGIRNKLDYLYDLGVNAIEIMPVAQFPGARNWGYDGVFPFAVQNTYGGPRQLKELINTCHTYGFSVIMDVVYNHLGPEGNFLQDFGPYFTSKYHTPWGKAMNFDDAESDPVRNYFLQNALMWFRDFHVDALRLDALHAIWDFGAKHIMSELKDVTDSISELTGQPRYLIAETNQNDSTYINSPDKGGYGLDGQWLDEFHHTLHATITGERGGYYADFGELKHLAKAYRESYVNNGTYSLHKKKTFGNSAKLNSGDQFVVFIQNHDQIGNRMKGERLSELVNFETLKLAALAVFIGPYTPMIFMGEEYMETNPFLYFIDHEDERLVQKVREGRKKDFKEFGYKDPPPDPKDVSTFNRSCLSWNQAQSAHKAMLELYKRLIRLKKEHPVVASSHKDHLDVTELSGGDVLIIERWDHSQRIMGILSFHHAVQEIQLTAITDICWKKLLDTSETEFEGPGSLPPEMVCKNDMIRIQPHSGVIFEGSF